jgi:acyl-coenzyme A synthetase/AMP-(fatty) acid ligase
METVPLVRHRELTARFAYAGTRAVTVAEFLRDVAYLVAMLPKRRHVLNLCSDRYRFTVGFAAALCRDQVSLLPPNHTPAIVEALLTRYPDLYCLTDDPAPQTELETIEFPLCDGENDGVAGIPDLPAQQLAAIVFTSGSTGSPMPHEKSWGSIAASAVSAADSLGILPHSGLALLGTVPPQHMYGLESTVLIAMQNGLALHNGRPFYPGDVLACLRTLPRPRMLVTTPIHLRTLLDDVQDLPPLDRIVCATAPLPPQLAAQAEVRFACPLFEIYGCTEAGQVASRRSVETAQWRTFGGIRLRQDQAGTWATGGHVEEEALLNDVIELCDARTFLLHGRTADLVNIAGKRTSLAHLNYHLNSIEGVRDGVFFMPDDDAGGVTRLMAFVVAPELSVQTVTSALRRRVDAAFMPRPLFLVESLPRNSTGKLTRESLTRLAAAGSSAARRG